MGPGDIREEETAKKNGYFPDKEVLGYWVEFGSDKGGRERQMIQQSSSPLFAFVSSNVKLVHLNKLSLNAGGFIVSTG